jgi:hypothetical protein
MRADGRLDALPEGGVDLPALGGQYLLHAGEGAEHHAGAHADHASAPILFDHLCIVPPWQRHPARLGHGAYGLAARRRHPVAAMGQQGGSILLEAVGDQHR